MALGPYLPKESLTSEQVLTLRVLNGISKCSSHGRSLFSCKRDLEKRSRSSATCQSILWFQQSVSPGTPVLDVSCDPHPGVSLVELAF